MSFLALVAAGALVPLALATPAVPLPQTADEIITVVVDRDDRMTVPVHIGKDGPYDFLVDTGSERTVLARDIALRLQLTAAGSATLVGIAGSETVDLVEVDEINLGRRSFYGLTAPLIEGHNIGADGILGIDSLQEQRVLLDFDKKHMLIGDAASLGGNKGFEIVVQARRRSGQLIMTNAVIDGVRTDIVVDTGSDTSIGNRALQRALARRSRSETTRLISVTGQSISADVGVARTFQLESLTINNTAIAFADTAAFDKLGLAKRPALLLGMNQLRLFHRVAIDFATRRVLFDMPMSAMISQR
jgi:predicted aspartyl protease